MGRQLAFYMLDDDLRRFLNYVSLTGRITCIQGQKFPTPEPLEIPLQNIPVPYVEGESHFYLWNKAIPGTPLVRFVIPKDKTKEKFYFLRVSESPLIEFRRCIIKNSLLTEGRVWIETTLLRANDSLQKKPEPFLRWFESITKWFRKNLKKLPDRWGNTVYVGQSALHWASQDGSLENVQLPDFLSNLEA